MAAVWLTSQIHFKRSLSSFHRQPTAKEKCKLIKIASKKLTCGLANPHRPDPICAESSLKVKATFSDSHRWSDGVVRGRNSASNVVLETHRLSLKELDLLLALVTEWGKLFICCYPVLTCLQETLSILARSVIWQMQHVNILTTGWLCPKQFSNQNSLQTSVWHLGVNSKWCATAGLRGEPRTCWRK